MFPDMDPADVALALSDAGDQVEAAVRVIPLLIRRVRSPATTRFPATVRRSCRAVSAIVAICVRAFSDVVVVSGAAPKAAPSQLKSRPAIAARLRRAGGAPDGTERGWRRALEDAFVV